MTGQITLERVTFQGPLLVLNSCLCSALSLLIQGAALLLSLTHLESGIQGEWTVFCVCFFPVVFVQTVFISHSVEMHYITHFSNKKRYFLTSINSHLENLSSALTYLLVYINTAYCFKDISSAAQ